MTDDFSGAVPPQPLDRRKVRTGCLWLALLVIGVPAACTAALSARGGSAEWEPTAVEARTICEDWVREQLRSPATARFQNGTSAGADGSYLITGTVDAENGFGALVRTPWTCEVDYRASDEKWHGSADLVE